MNTYVDLEAALVDLQNGEDKQSSTHEFEN